MVVHELYYKRNTRCTWSVINELPGSGRHFTKCETCEMERSCQN